MSGSVRRGAVAGIVLSITACGSPHPAASPPGAGAKGNAEQAFAADAWPYGYAPNADEQRAQLDRLLNDPGPLRSNWTPPGKAERYGRAEGLINAPYDVVKARLLDYAHYKDLAGPKFKKVSVVDKSNGATDVYFQLPIMRGIITLWYITRFGVPHPMSAGGDVIEGRFVKGNVKDMQVVFALRPVAESKQTILVCDINLTTEIPAPQEALDETLRDACGDAVNAVRAHTTQL
jgi:hypothetical protein